MLNNGILIDSPSDGEIVKVTREKIKKVPLPGYTIWGNGHTTRGGTSMDILEIMKDLGKPEITLMQFFRDEMRINQTNHSETPNIVKPASSANYSDYYKVALKKHYAHMECLGILKRVKRGSYMLNPLLYIPYKYNEEMLALWESLEKKNCDDQEDKNTKSI